MQNYLEFEKPVAEIELKIAELRAIADSPDADMNLEKEVKTLGQKAQTLLEKLYADLTPWRKCQVARHGNRPHFVDYTRALFTDYLPYAVIAPLAMITRFWAGWRGLRARPWF